MKEGCRPLVGLPRTRAGKAIALALVVGSAAAGQAAFAQPPRAPAARPAVAPRASPRKTAASADAGAGASIASPSSPGGAFGSGPAYADAGALETKSFDGGTHVFKFNELDIEGQLKSPQLVYFLRRVRAEFGAADLGHRTFLREMSETRKEPSF